MCEGKQAELYFMRCMYAYFSSVKFKHVLTVDNYLYVLLVSQSNSDWYSTEPSLPETRQVKEYFVNICEQPILSYEPQQNLLQSNGNL